jgi:translation initiation factor 3 subunit L
VAFACLIFSAHSAAGNVNMLLPNSWLWAMVDEFLYQFQSFAQYRAKLSSKSAEEIELLKKCDKVGSWI